MEIGLDHSRIVEMIQGDVLIDFVHTVTYILYHKIPVDTKMTDTAVILHQNDR